MERIQIEYKNLGGEKEKMEKKNLTKSITVVAVVLSVLAVVMVGTASANSLYLIADHHSAAFDAWNINPSGTATYQSTYTLQWATDPAGVAVDESSNTLFVTSEFSLAGIEFVDATTMTSKGKTTTGLTNMAGIDVDDATGIVYTIKRGMNTLYAYDWNPGTNTLSLRSGYPVTLPGCSGGYGIALDENTNILWVADGYGPVARAYNVGTWTEDTTKSFTPSHAPIDIAVDRVRGIVYTVSMNYGAGGPGGSLLLSKYDLATGTETVGTLNCQGVGVAVDEATGYVYVTISPYCTGVPSSLQVWDTSVSPWTQVDIDTMQTSPAGICIHQTGGFNPLGLTKDDGLSGACVNAGGTITYIMSYTNGNPTTVTGVTLVDTLPPEVSYVSCTGTGGCTQAGNTVTWSNIGSLTSGQSGSATLTVQVNAGTAGLTVIDNAATINANEPNTGPTTVHKLTTVCSGGVIPEFSTIAIPVASILGLLFFFNYRKRRREQ